MGHRLCRVLRGRHFQGVDVVTPSPATRASWAQHFGVAQEAVPVVESVSRRMRPFTEQRAPKKLELPALLLAFGLSSRSEAEAIGKRELETRAGSASRKARGTSGLEET